MAAASSCRPLPLLRRPLPPKPSTPPPSIRSTPQRNIASSRDVRILSEPATAKAISPIRGIQYRGDVPLPKASVVRSHKPKGPDPLPARPPKKPRELPAEAFIKDSYVPPPPLFTLRDFVRKRLSKDDTEDSNEPMVSDQNYEKLTSWLNTNKPQQVEVHSQEINSKNSFLSSYCDHSS